MLCLQAVSGGLGSTGRTELGVAVGSCLQSTACVLQTGGSALLVRDHSKV